MSTVIKAVEAFSTEKIGSEQKQSDAIVLSACEVSEISGGADACQILGGALGGAIGALGGGVLGAVGGAIGAGLADPCPPGAPTVNMSDIIAA